MYREGLYQKSLQNMLPPVMPSQLPKVKIDFRGVVAYAKSKGVAVDSLSEEEKLAFCQAQPCEGPIKVLP